MLGRLFAWLRSRRSSDDRDGTVWDVIPSWQYGGLHAESGGFTRDEQERALGDVQRQADELADERH